MMGSMESFGFPKQETISEKERIRIEAYKKSQELFEKNAIREDSFVDTYGEDAIQGHLRVVADLEEKFKKDKDAPHENASNYRNEEVKQYGDIFEAVVFDMIKRCEWFGKGVRPVKASKFDDYVNKVDVLVDLEHSRKPLALAIDVTFGFKGMQKKVSEILHKIDEDKLSFVRYYRSEDESYEGKVNNLARVVVGVEMDTVQKLSEYWIANDDEMLRAHYAQTLILSEIAIQLREYARYARHRGNERVARVYEADLEKVEVILVDKPDEHMDNYDRVYDCIMQVVDGINHVDK